MPETEEGPNINFLSLLPATAGPSPTFYEDDAGDVVKVVLDMVSVDTNKSWGLSIEPMGGSKLRVRVAN